MEQQRFIKEVIDLAFSYINDNEDEITIEGFVGYLSGLLDGKSNPSTEQTGQVNTETDDLGIRLVLLNRYAGEYVKMALEDTPLQTGDEFTFLVALYAEGSHTKTELISKMLLTKTSGTEVLKRLISKSMIDEHDDENDRRSKRVNLSSKGRELVEEMLPRMGRVSSVIRGNLQSSELRSINYLLRKLQKHHEKIFDQHSRDYIKNNLLQKGTTE